MYLIALTVGRAFRGRAETRDFCVFHVELLWAGGVFHVKHFLQETEWTHAKVIEIAAETPK